MVRLECRLATARPPKYRRDGRLSTVRVPANRLLTVRSIPWGCNQNNKRLLRARLEWEAYNISGEILGRNCKEARSTITHNHTQSQSQAISFVRRRFQIMQERSRFTYVPLSIAQQDGFILVFFILSTSTTYSNFLFGYGQSTHVLMFHRRERK